MSLGDPTEIFLQPKCCAGDEGRLWCEDPDPEECEEEVPWTRYIRADLQLAREEIERRLNYEEGRLRHSECPPCYAAAMESYYAVNMLKDMLFNIKTKEERICGTRFSSNQLGQI